MEIVMNANELEVLSKQFNLNNIILFGSVLTEDFHEDSDIDIAVLGKDILSLDEIFELEMYFENKFNREIDVVDLRSRQLDIFVKMNILNTGKSIYTNDDNQALEMLIDETERYYRENETFFFFRRRDLLT